VRNFALIKLLFKHNAFRVAHNNLLVQTIVAQRKTPEALRLLGFFFGGGEGS
jgi:hypothetical protein